MVCVGTGHAYQCASWAVPLPVVRQIGQHTDDLTGKDTWLRIPRIITRVPITRASFNVTSTVGGLIFVRVPAGLSLGNVTVSALGAASVSLAGNSLHAGHQLLLLPAAAGKLSDMLGDAPLLHLALPLAQVSFASVYRAPRFRLNETSLVRPLHAERPPR